MGKVIKKIKAWLQLKLATFTDGNHFNPYTSTYETFHIIPYNLLNDSLLKRPDHI